MIHSLCNLLDLEFNSESVTSSITSVTIICTNACNTFTARGDKRYAKLKTKAFVKSLHSRCNA